jgi:hypothetical protein
MFGFMMLVFLMWARSDRGGDSNLGWLEKVRSNSFDRLVTPAPATAPTAAATPATTSTVSTASAPTIDDDEHLAAYNDYLARLNQSGQGPASRQ